MDRTEVSKTRLVSYWEGPVTWVERLCVASMLRHGHELAIFTYDFESLSKCSLVPDIRDAREVAKEGGAVHRYRAAGRYDVFTDLFRLELLRQSKGVWVDLDCYLVRPLAPQMEYVFGQVTPKKLNNAVLHLPSDCPMIDDYISSITADPLRTPWLPFRRRLRRDIEILFGRSQPHTSVRTNTATRALTYFARKHGVIQHATAPEVYYPVANKEVPLLFDADPSGAAAKLTARTVLIHLWRSSVKQLGQLAHLPPATSYLGSACAELGVATAG